MWIRAATLCLFLSVMTPLASAQTQLQAANNHIHHVILIIQENRSFEHYFGTFPGADGIQFDSNGVPLMCYPLSKTGGGCVRPFHDRHNLNGASDHGALASILDIDHNAMDGFLIDQVDNFNKICFTSQAAPWCIGAKSHDAVGYHTADEIPNYWAYAQHFVLQDHLHEAVASHSMLSHLYATSGWSATCTDNEDPFSCTGNIQLEPPAIAVHNFAWSDLTDLMDRAAVSWKYYLGEGEAPDCENDEVDCPPKDIQSTVPSLFNPLPGFQEIQDKNTANPGYLAAHNPPLEQFYADLAAGSLPTVSWIVPANNVSEHPPKDITAGMQYVTGLVNAVMQSSAWQDTVIFLAWDDWGGFFDHVVPPVSDLLTNPVPPIPKTARVGYGIRVPGIIISRWVKAGTIDHQIISFDAYLKFIEDLFLNSHRIGGAAGLRPDSRPVVRELLTSVTQPTGTAFTGRQVPVGDLLNDFNFNQTPLAPLILLTGIPNTFRGGFDAEKLASTFPLTWDPPANASVAGYNVYRTTTSGSNYQPVPGCSTAFGRPFRGTSCTDTMVQPGVTYHYVVRTVHPNGAESPRTGEVDITP